MDEMEGLDVENNHKMMEHTQEEGEDDQHHDENDQQEMEMGQHEHHHHMHQHQSGEDEMHDNGAVIGAEVVGIDKFDKDMIAEVNKKLEKQEVHKFRCNGKVYIRKKRVPLDPQKKEKLEQAYVSGQVPRGRHGRARKEQLAKELGMSLKAINKWFDNRRIKDSVQNKRLLNYVDAGMDPTKISVAGSTSSSSSGNKRKADVPPPPTPDDQTKFPRVSEVADHFHHLQQDPNRPPDLMDDAEAGMRQQPSRKEAIGFGNKLEQNNISLGYVDEDVRKSFRVIRAFFAGEIELWKYFAEGDDVGPGEEDNHSNTASGKKNQMGPNLYNQNNHQLPYPPLPPDIMGSTSSLSSAPPAAVTTGDKNANNSNNRFQDEDEDGKSKKRFLIAPTLQNFLEHVLAKGGLFYPLVRAVQTISGGGSMKLLLARINQEEQDFKTMILWYCVGKWSGDMTCEYLVRSFFNGLNPGLSKVNVSEQLEKHFPQLVETRDDATPDQTQVQQEKSTAIFLANPSGGSVDWQDGFLSEIFVGQAVERNGVEAEIIEVLPPKGRQRHPRFKVRFPIGSIAVYSWELVQGHVVANSQRFQAPPVDLANIVNKRK